MAIPLEAMGDFSSDNTTGHKSSAEMREIIESARGIVLHGRSTTYPSVSSAERVRNVMAELVMALQGRDAKIGELEGDLKNRTTERDYHKRMADKLAERIRALDPDFQSPQETTSE